MEALDIKSHITLKGEFFSSAATWGKKLLISMKSRKHIKSKHNACKKESYVFSAPTDRHKICTLLHNVKKRHICSLLVKTGDGHLREQPNTLQSFTAFYGFLQGSLNKMTNCKKIPHKNMTKRKLFPNYLFLHQKWV